MGGHERAGAKSNKASCSAFHDLPFVRSFACHTIFYNGKCWLFAPTTAFFRDIYRCVSGIWKISALKWCDHFCHTRRAPSSPHLACGLNGSFFLRPCGPPSATEAGRLLGVVGMLKTCGTLHRGGYSSKRLKASLWR